ncbi:Mobile element protein [Rhodococcus sp. B7740]|nr:Mobile element protein [Rhodococcus sp. B7740]
MERVRTVVLDYDVEIRRVICSTNAIESVNARYRRAVRARGHFPTEQAALKCLYLATRALDPTGKGRARWAMRRKPALNAFAIEISEDGHDRESTPATVDEVSQLSQIKL